jgi:hypothetical protein
MVAIFGTEDYGMPENAKFSTKEELELIKEEGIPFYMIRMCDQFLDDATSIQFSSTLPCYCLAVGSSVPSSLLEGIISMYNSLGRDEV